MNESPLWRSRAIFITSTFRDMQAERDWLSAHVFPVLEERLLERFHHLEVVDLRWGVDSASTAEGTRESMVLSVCLGEIKRCRPFLVGLLGDRYGWRPQLPAAMNHAAREAGFDEDVTGKSVTELEILFGALAGPDQQKRSWFYLRDPLPYERMGADGARYSDEYSQDAADPRNVASLRHLKDRLTATLPGRVRTYRVNWNPTTRAIEQTDLKTWGEQVLKDLWSDLDAETAAFLQQAPRTWQQQERWLLDEFVERKARTFVGRRTSLQGLLDGALSTAAEDSPWAACVTGAPGAGKSTLFAQLCRRLHLEDVVLLAHAAGIGVRSTQVDLMLRRFAGELAAIVGQPDVLDERSTSSDIDVAFNRLLHQVAATRRVVLAVDAFNLFETTPRATYVTWLPKEWPANARLIVTTVPGQASEVLLQRPGVTERALGPLHDLDEARAIVRVICRRYHRTLNTAVEDALLAKRDRNGAMSFGNPLWLEIATEELNLLDSQTLDTFDTKDGSDESGADRVVSMLLDVVHRMPGDAADLYGFMLDRAERHFGQGWTRAFVNTIAVSRGGWREMDFADFMPALSGEAGATWDPLRFAGVRRAFRTHVVQTGRDGQWTFAHEQMRAAVTRRSFASPTSARQWHRRLADHLERLPVTDPVAQSESMFHVIRADDLYRGARVYADDVRASGDTLWELHTRAASWATQALNQYISEDEGEGIGWAAALLDQDLPESDDFAVASGIVLEVAARLLETSPVAGGMLLQMCVNHLTNRWNRSPRTHRHHWAALLHQAYTSLGACAIAAGRAAEAERWLRDALAIAESIASENAPADVHIVRVASAHAKLGDLWMRLARDPEQAFGHYTRAVAIVGTAQSDAARNTWIEFECDVAECQLAMGELIAAARTFESAYDATLRHDASDSRQSMEREGIDERLSVLEEKLGNIALRQNDAPRATLYFQQSLARRQRLLERNPGRLDWARAVAVASSKLGDAHLKNGDLLAADRAYQEDLRITRTLWKRTLDRSDVGRDLAVTYHKLARLRSQQNRHKEAISYLTDCRRTLAELMRKGVAFDQQMRQLWQALIGG
jgi:tetratricopeptide (TPR) repeat protein